MSKVSVAFALISTLAFTSANAPTFQLWRDLPTAAVMSPDDSTASYTTDYVPGALFGFHGLNQELSEEGALDRFEVDDMFLPKLNVELPELFDWSDIENTYFAQDTATLSAPPSFALDNYGGAAFRVASLGASGNGGIGARIASSAAATEQSTQSAGKSSGGGSEQITSSDPIGEEVPAPQDEEQFAGIDVPTNLIDQIVQLPTDTSMMDKLIDTPAPIASTDPVQVPAPGAFGLFVLGLAGLRLAVRKKNGSG
ncbi:MAG TPA: hypothetical protein VNA21_07040 [Steroidobacteraceae bacterium]|nr:hypothetical protein [Steroidobacteraceae bacterium]